MGFRELQSFEIDFITSTGETIGSAISSVRANMITKRLLEETRQQAELLRQQEEQLIRTNEELSVQSKLLQESEEELLESNRELKLNAREMQHKNDVLEQAREALVIKAKELELNNKFKSEFLANMSHELRTPLNSVLILAKLLADNPKQNLTEKQTEYAKVIHKSGNDLLNLINDILDLSKIEAGKIELMPEETVLNEITNDMQMLFIEVANEKKINFNIEIDPTLPERYVTDKMRLEQVIKNLLSNAFKFTPSGGHINFRIGRPSADLQFSNSNLYNQNAIIEFSVSDTGIGIPEEKQALIFEAFQQADGSTNRRYGGTGLGLSISKMLVSLLGGEMKLKSEQTKGSTFSVFLPFKMDFKQQHQDVVPRETTPRPASKEQQVVQDDRAIVSSKDKILLIAEEDLRHANALVDFAHERNYKAVIARDSIEVMDFANRFTPSAIIMNMVLADTDGLSVLNKIRQSDSLKHIPVHMMSAANKPTLSKTCGANGFLKKPLDKHDLDIAFTDMDVSIEKGLKRILLVEDVSIHQEIIKNLLTSHHGQIHLSSAGTIAEAKKFISENEYDCIVLDLDLGNGAAEGFEFLRSLREAQITSTIPVIIFTGQELSEAEMTTLSELSQAVVSKNAESLDLLLEETDQFLYAVDKHEEGVVNAGSQIPNMIIQVLAGKSVLVVDDDMRNIYALTSILEAEDMNVVTACNGVEAIHRIKENPSYDIILMDIMMPEMDGYTAMKEIR